ncbi:MAG: LLM class flavin-dependent oxidoreductase [Microbacterium sp.]
MARTLELGLDTFGDVTTHPDGTRKTDAETIRDVVAQAELADALGIDAFGLGEHHRHEFAVSSPEIVLAAIAARTRRIRVGTAVTVLSSDDPVRVYERFATLDAVSSGRAEITLGRGSFTESFPLFGYDLKDYEVLFEEKLDLFGELLREEPVSWEGRVRAALTDADVFPKTEGGIRTWVGVGGSPDSVVRTARHGFGLMLAIIGGAPAQFQPFVDLFHRAASAHGFDRLPVGVHSPGHVADTDEQAWEELFPAMKANRDAIGAERGWPPYSRLQFQRDLGPDGAVYAGSPETVARKIAATAERLGLDRFDLKFSNGTLSHARMLRSIELYGTRIAPRVQELLAEHTASASA